jgi:subfamily B ATP-binding cassette protein HlyB/CyaB
LAILFPYYSHASSVFLASHWILLDNKHPNPPEADSSADPADKAAQDLDPGLACLVALAHFHGIAADPQQLAHSFVADGQRIDAQGLLLAARHLGLHGRLVQPKPQRLNKMALPAIGLQRDGGFFVLARLDGDPLQPSCQFLLQDGDSGRMVQEDAQTFGARWDGRLILLASRASILGELAPFDFSWFIPSIVKYRRLLGEVLLVSLVLQLFALGTPLFFQVVMDKVLVNRAYQTLDVVAFGLLVVVVFEVALSYLRTHIFTHTASRIDVELGAKLFRHMLALPVAYYQSRRVGDSVARAQELENIRSFLTGQAITVLLDIAFAVVFLGVMLWYSPALTLIVVVSLPCYVALSVLITPELRRRLDEKFRRHAENQSFLVESVSGIDTIKSLAVEPPWMRRWEQQLAAYVKASFRTATIGNVAGNGVTLISKLVTVATMWLGAHLVIEGQLTVGQLIAFNMLAGHVSGPVIRLAQLWTDLQQVGVSVKRLGDILNVRTEVSSARSTMPALSGRITLDKVLFRYRPDAQPALRGLSVDIAPGEVVGVVGRSGSGKSTLAKLVQRLYVPEAGRVMVDGMDLALIDASSLRRQIGVVLQENMLFGRSIRDNIALTDPGVALDRVIAAAKLAGAHEFIVELPEAYDTMVGEHGTGLSGGQRQRIGIARALIGNPRILIFDEATSALDYESERIIQDNMRDICAGRTVVIIAHRLSAVRDADRILVMDRGDIVEQGPHAQLLAQGGAYARLHAMQQG